MTKASMYLIDICFFIDIILNFNSCFYFDEVNLIEDRSEIACNYIKGWFFIDTIAIIPFEVIFGATSDSKTTSVNHMIRVVRMGKLSKIIRVTKMLRVFKIL